VQDKQLHSLASGGTSYSWSGPSGFTANTASTGNITAAGAYNVTVTDGNGCTSSCSRTLTVNALPIPTAGSNSSVCAGSTLNLTSSGGTAYSWTGPNSFTSALQNPSITNVTAAAAGTYTVTVTNASGCTATASTTVAINPRPIPTITGTNSICLNSSSVYTTEAGMSAYLWTVSAGGTITAGTGTNSITVNWTTSGPKTVTVNYTNANGCTAASATSFAVTVNPLPVCGITGTNTICAGQTTSFSASGGTSYSWSGPSGFTANTASTGNITAAGAYNVTVTDGNGCTSSCSRTLTVNALPIPTAGSNSSVCQGSTLTLTSSGGSSYNWSGPNGFTSTSQNPSITNVLLAAAGTYNVTVTNASGCTATATTSVIITPLPTANISYAGSPFCAGQTTASPTLTGTNAYTGGTYGAPAGLTINPSTGVIDFTTSTPGSYTVSYTLAAAGGCPQVVATTTVGFGTPPVITTNPPADFGTCQQNSLIIISAASGSPTPTVQWQTRPSSAGTWTDISGATNPTLNYTGVSPSDDGRQFQAIYTNLCGTVITNITTLHVGAPINPGNVPPANVTGCDNLGTASFTATANGGNGVVTMSWEYSPDNGTTWFDIPGTTSTSNLGNYSTTYTFTPTASQNGYLFRAKFTNGGCPASYAPLTRRSTFNGSTNADSHT
jgi:hypothetical protein